MKMFLSDNNSGVHPEIMDALKLANLGHTHPYGKDRFTEQAKKQIRRLFNSKPEIFFVTTGTAANVISLSSLLNSYEAVICADTSHINVDECGALEKLNGTKLLYTENNNGKINLDKIKPLLEHSGDEHRIQPKVISISQPTELGTVYSVDEIQNISDFAHRHNLYLHIDGARLANAVAALNTTFEKIITETNVDILSFGGTKNGLMMGEAILSFTEQASQKLNFIRKQNCQLISKMRFISSQFSAYLHNDLWLKNASNANSMAKLLIKQISHIKSIHVKYNVDTNMIFMTMPSRLSEELLKYYDFHIIDRELNLTRFVTSFDTTEKDINQLVDQIVNSCKKLNIG